MSGTRPAPTDPFDEQEAARRLEREEQRQREAQQAGVESDGPGAGEAVEAGLDLLGALLGLFDA